MSRPVPHRLLAELATGLVASAVLIVALSVLVGLGPVGWVAGTLYACGLVAVLVGSGEASLGPAGKVTLARGVLIGGVVALVADPVSIPALVVLAAVALALDGVDGYVARRRQVASAFGARFDMELDAFLILVLAVHVAGLLGSWVLLIGLLRYAFVAAGAIMPWLTGELPVRRSAKVVAAAQGVVLVVASSQLLPVVVSTVLVAAALLALVWSFAGSVVHLWRAADTHPVHLRPAAGAVATALAVLLVVLALTLPGDFPRLVPQAVLRIPLEALVGLVVLMALPTVLRRPLAWAAGALLGVLLVLTVLDQGFSVSLARPFDPARDSVLLGNAYDFVAETSGPVVGVIASVVAALLALAFVVGGALGVARLAGIASRHRWAALRLVGVLAAGWIVAWAASLQLVPGLPVASESASVGVVDRAVAIQRGLADQRAFEAEARVDAYANVPADRLLTALRGHDVVVAVVESYGMAALQDPAMNGPVRAAVEQAQQGMGAAGYGMRTGVLTSPVAGGGSWLAHATLLSGLWIDGEGRHRDLVSSDRLTLTRAFHEAGWRTVAVAPGTTSAWPEASFFGYDKAYGADDLGYRGPRFSWSTMPDQYALSAFDRLERRPGAPPTMAEIALTSSHAPWTPLPRTVPWEAVGDGGVFGPEQPQQAFNAIFTTDPAQVRDHYRDSIVYSMQTLAAWSERQAALDPARAPVIVVLGDHQPSPVVTGSGASHDVPISVITRDPAVLDRIDSWSWAPGLVPGPTTPVWPMNAFRDRFLDAYGTRP